MPNYDNLYAKAQGLLNSDDKAGALTLLIKCSKSKSYKLRCLRIMGGIYGQLSDYTHAVSCFKQATKLDAKNAELWYFLAMAMVFADKNQTEILPVFKRAIKVNPQYALAWYGTGSVYRDMGDYGKAKEHLLKALEIDGHQLDARISLATIYRDEGDYDKALTEFEQCISLKPSSPEALAGKSLTLFYKGDVVTAEAEIVSLASNHASNKIIASAYSEICKQGEHANDALRYLKNTLTDKKYTPIEVRDLAKAAAKLSDLLGEYDEAFEYARLANIYIRDRFDANTYLSQQPYSKIQSTLRVTPLCNNEYDSDITPIFILGMPRSGSTLVEQVLSCHPDICAGGELTNFYQYTLQSLETNNTNDVSQLDNEALLEVGRKYMADLKELAGGKKYITDKLPGNFEKIGWINALFPNAKIINTNRNKLDVSVSCYFQNFGTKHPYVCDINTLVSAYQYYEEVLSFWREQSEIKIYDASYENLITDTKGEVGDMLSYLDLPWSDACLEHHKSERVAKTASFDQVRQPLYNRSIGRWKNYEKHIPELLTAFGSG